MQANGRDSTFALIICMSGKRKSGKDYVAKLLADELLRQRKARVYTCGISHPLKDEYAKIHGLDTKLLKSNDLYKEKYRADMVKYGEQIRDACPGYFCKKAMEMAKELKCEMENGGDAAVCRNPNNQQPRILLVTDCRRPTDLDYFKSHQKNGQRHTMLIRIEASIDTREQRGFEPTTGIDDEKTECALDEFHEWDHIICNNGDSDALQRDLEHLVQGVCKSL